MPFVRSVQESSVDLAWLATSPDVAGVSGKYFDCRKQVMSSPLSNDEAKQEDLWNWTVKTAGFEGDGLDGLKNLSQK